MLVDLTSHIQHQTSIFQSADDNEGEGKSKKIKSKGSGSG
jgi:hypothetical protein